MMLRCTLWKCSRIMRRGNVCCPFVACTTRCADVVVSWATGWGRRETARCRTRGFRGGSKRRGCERAGDLIDARLECHTLRTLPCYLVPRESAMRAVIAGFRACANVLTTASSINSPKSILRELLEVFARG